MVILGSAVGLLIGAWINFQAGIIRGPPVDPPYPVLWPSAGMLGLSFLRLVIGLALLGIVRTVVKSSVRSALVNILTQTYELQTPFFVSTAS